MYLVGNGSYFSPNNDRLPKHWFDTIKALSSKALSDTNKGEELAEHFLGPRLGPCLPLCCPLHRPLSLRNVKAGETVSVKCVEICRYILPCGHECALPCHYSTPDSHNPSCEVLLDSPCREHPKTIPCNELMRGDMFSSVEEALIKYRCLEKESVKLPCGHEGILACADENDYALKKKPWPPCKKKALNEIRLPCKHVLKNVLCHEYERKRQGAVNYPCKEEVNYLPSCGHEKLIKCYLAKDYLSNKTSYRCPERVKISLPRCLHEVEVDCQEMLALGAWRGISVREEGVVQEGVVYGTLDHRCNKKVRFQRKCGHEEIKNCTDAFYMSSSDSIAPCSKMVKILKNSCGHTVSVACPLAWKYEMARLGKTRGANGVEVVKEGYRSLEFIPDPDNSPMISCSHLVEVQRKCGHSLRIMCDKAKEYCLGNWNTVLPPCESIVRAQSPLCFHPVDVPCSMKKAVEEWKPWSCEILSSTPVKEGILSYDLPPPTINPPDTISKIVKKWNCDQKLQFFLPCGHKMVFSCNRALRLLGKKTIDLPFCTESITLQLPCGHEESILCRDKEKPRKCSVKVQRECWNYSSCKQRPEVLCSTSLVSCNSPKGKFTCDKNCHTFPLECKMGRPLFCPGCSINSFREEVQMLETHLAQQLRPTISSDLFDLMLKHKGYRSQPKSKGQTPRDFLINCLKSHKRLLKEKLSNSPWEIFQETAHVVPVFTTETAFRPTTTDFGHGTIAYPLVTQALRPHIENCKGTGVCFLIGLAVVSCPLGNVRPVGKKNAKSWAPKQRQKGHDCAWMADKNKFVFWNEEESNAPPISVLGKLSLAAKVAKGFLSELKRGEIGERGKEWENILPCKNDFVKSLPKTATVMTGGSSKEAVKNAALFNLLNRWCDFIFGNAEDGKLSSNLKLLPSTWDGSLVTERTSLPSNVLSKLSGKLQFFGGGPGESENPFQVINLLEKIGGDGFVHSALFEGLEHWHLGFEENGKDKARKYIEELGRKEVEGHPLLLYILALCVGENRYLPGPVSPSSSRILGLPDLEKADGRSFFYTVFLRLYGEELANKWFLSLLPKNLSANLSSNTKAKESVAERWKKIKLERKCRSAAMDELCQMVGLERVKEKALSFFEIYVKYSAEFRRRELGKDSLNFAFLGNPGTGCDFVVFSLS